MSRLHMRKPRSLGDGLDFRESLCGMTAVDVTEDAGLVRCRLCRKRMPDASTPPPVVEAVPDAPFVQGEPQPLEDVQGTHVLDERSVRIIERSGQGDDTSDRPRWRTLDKAIEKTNAIRSSSSSIRSSWKEEFLPGGGAVRTIDGRDDVLQIDLAMSRAFTSPVTLGALTLTAEQACRVLTLALRGVEDAPGLAAKLDEQFGVYVTEHQVRTLIRNGKAAMREQLAAKGVIEAQREREETKSEEASMAGAYETEGWKNIAAVVGRSESACKRYAALDVDPLPVVDQMGRIAAKKTELEAWLVRQTKAYSAA